jgi:hypothetical protein
MKEAPISKHTPGPWVANLEDAPEYCRIEIASEGGIPYPIATVRNADDKAGGDS